MSVRGLNGVKWADRQQIAEWAPGFSLACAARCISMTVYASCWHNALCEGGTASSVSLCTASAREVRFAALTLVSCRETAQCNGSSCRPCSRAALPDFDYSVPVRVWHIFNSRPFFKSDRLYSIKDVYRCFIRITPSIICLGFFLLTRFNKTEIWNLRMPCCMSMRWFSCTVGPYCFKPTEPCGALTNDSESGSWLESL